MIKYFFTKLIVILLILATTISPITGILVAKADDSTIGNPGSLDIGNPSTEDGGVWGDTGEVEVSQADIDQTRLDAVPEAITSLDQAVNPTDYPQSANTQINPLTSAFSNLFQSSGAKIIFKSSDAEEVRQLTCLRDVIPDYENDFTAIMQARKNLTYDAIYKMKANQPTTFAELVKTLQNEKMAALPTELLLPEHRTQLACILREDTVLAVDQRIKDDAAFVNAQIAAAIDSLHIDVRVLKMLIYLVTPKNQGGAGHDLIKVYRLRKGYDTPQNQMDQESQAIIEAKKRADAQSAGSAPADQTVGEASESPAQAAGTASGQVVDDKTTSDFAVGIDDSENQVISAHAEGQAIDIEAVDNIRCTLIQKRRVGSDKKVLQPPKPINLIWQTEEGYSKSSEGQRDTVANMANSLYRDGLMDLLDSYNIDVNNMDDLSTANLGDVLDTVGDVLIGQLINTNGNITGANLKETLQKVGAVYLADKLDLPRAAIYGTGYSNLDDLKANLGRATLEAKLGMPFGSLIGENPAQIFYSIGERKMETQLNLPIGTLTPDISSEKQLLIKIGASLVETKLNLNRGSFLNPKLEDIKKAVGELKFNTLFSMPQVIDTRLGLGDGQYSEKFKNGIAKGGISPADYLYTIAAKHMTDNAYVWTAYVNNVCSWTIFAGIRRCDENSGTTPQWDSVFNLPQNATTGAAPLMDDVLVGHLISALPEIGKDDLTKKLTNRTEEQGFIKNWLTSSNSTTAAAKACPAAQPMSGEWDNPATPAEDPVQVTIDEIYLNSRLGLRAGDFYQIFGCSLGGAGAVLSNIGGSRLYQAIKNSDTVNNEKNQFLAEHPEIVALIQEIDFYKSRVDDINRHLDILDRSMETLKTDPQTKDAYDAYIVIRNKIKNHRGSSIKAYQDLAREAKTQFGILRTRAATSDKFKTIINTCLTEVDAIFFDLQEIITGEDNGRLSDFRFSELTINDSRSSTGVNKMNLKRAVWLLLTGKATVQDVIVYMGGGMIEDKLDLPANTFYYFVQSLNAANSEHPDQTNLWNSSENPPDLNYDLGGGDTATFNTSYLNSLGGSAARQTSDQEVKAKNQARERFMASLGQAALEEQMGLAPKSFQGTTVPDPSKTEQDIGSVVANLSTDSSVSEAKAKLMNGFGTNVSFDQLVSGNASAWNQANASFQNFDHTLNLPLGTTQAFLTGVNQRLSASAYLSTEEKSLVSAKLNIPEQVLTKLTKVLAGDENWQMTDITLKNFNPYQATTATGTSCLQAIDGQIVYTDMDGEHLFATQELAYAYYQSHKNRYLDYIGQIVKGINGATGNMLTADLIANLTKYLRDLTTLTAFDAAGGTLNAISGFTGVPIEVLKRLFTRTANKSNLFNYLVSVGENVSEQRLRYALLNNFGVSLGGVKLTGNDLFDMLSGSGMTVLYRTAGAFLDSEAGLATGTFARILSAPNSGTRECLLIQAGASLVFKRLGIPAFDLSGNPYHNIGSSKIESALNWPKGSFKSDSPKGTEAKTTGLEDLIKNVGVNAFVQGFKIPLSGLDFRSTARLLFPADKAKDIDRLSNAQILDRLDAIQTATPLNDPANGPTGSLTQARTNLTNLVVNRLKLMQDQSSVVWTYKETGSGLDLPATLLDFTVDESNILFGQMASAALFKPEILAFQRRVGALDSDLRLRILGGESPTRKLLTGALTPDAYRDQVSNTQIGMMTVAGIALLLGFDPEDPKVRTAMSMFEKFKTNGSDWDHWSAGDRLAFFNNFQSLFGLNLDDAAGFRQGTFGQIIAYPDRARNILISEGLYRLDRSIFKAESPFSTEKIFAAYVGPGPDNPGSSGVGRYQECDIGSGTVNSALGLHGTMVTKCHYIQGTEIAGAIDEASNQMAEFLISQACPNGPTPIDGKCWLLYNQNPTDANGNALTGRTNVTNLLAQFLRTGNTSVLAAIANASLAAKINSTLNSSLHLSFLPDGFQITWEDIVGATYGNRGLEDVASERATYQTLLEIETPALIDNVTSEPSNFERDDGYGVAGQVNLGGNGNPYLGSNTNRQAATYGVTPMVQHNIDSAYTAFDQARNDTLADQYLTPPNVNDGTYGQVLDGLPTSQGFRAAYEANLDLYNSHVSAVNSARSTARDRVRQSYQKNLEYRYFDALLYAKDKNIPPGFAAAMFEGNAHTRANALVAWFQNGVRQGDFLGVSIPDYAQIPLLYLSDMLNNNNRTAFDHFVSSGAINTFDGFLVDRFREAIGISFEPGTFTAVIAGISNNGHFKQDGITVGGKTYDVPSLETIYKQAFAERISSWVDRQLGFDVGSAYKMYTGYKAYETARHAYNIANAAHEAAAAYLAHLKAIGVTPGVGSEVVNNEVTTGADAANAKAKMTQLKGELIVFIITTVFAKQIAALETSWGLVPGSGALLISILLLPFNPITLGIFILMNLFGYYKTELRCTADGYYPEASAPPSGSVADNGGLGVFDGMNMTTKKTEFVRAAQYKARVLLGDVLSMPERFADQRMTPSQIMTGRKEDVDYWYPKTLDVIYRFTGAPDANGVIPSRAGLWQNPQTTAYTHIGF